MFFEVIFFFLLQCFVELAPQLRLHVQQFQLLHLLDWLLLLFQGQVDERIIQSPQKCSQFVFNQVMRVVAQLKWLEQVEQDPRHHEAFAQESEEQEVVVAELLEQPWAGWCQLLVETPDWEEGYHRPRSLECADLVRGLEHTPDQVGAVDLLLNGCHVHVVDVLVERVSVPACYFDLACVCIQVVRGHVRVLVEMLQWVEIIELTYLFYISFNVIFTCFTLLTIITRSYIEKVCTEEK